MHSVLCGTFRSLPCIHSWLLPDHLFYQKHREQARYAGRFPVPSALIHRLSLTASTPSNPSPHQKASHTPQRTLQKCVPRKGEREGEIRGLRNSERFPPRKFPPGNNSRISPAVSQRYVCIHTLKRNAFNH